VNDSPLAGYGAAGGPANGSFAGTGTVNTRSGALDSDLIGNPPPPISETSQPDAVSIPECSSTSHKPRRHRTD